MGRQSLVEKVKDIVYLVVLPIYLWSIGFKTLEQYIQAIIVEEEGLGNIKTGEKPLYNVTK